MRPLEPLKLEYVKKSEYYTRRVAFAALTVTGGITMYIIGEQNKKLVVEAGGLLSVGWGLYEMIKNAALSITSNFKKNLEDKII